MKLGKSIINLIEESVCQIRRGCWLVIDSSESSVAITWFNDYSFSNQIWQSVSDPVINSSIKLSDEDR